MNVTITIRQKPKRITVSSSVPGVVVTCPRPLNVSVSLTRDGAKGKSAFELWLVDNPDGTREQYDDYYRGAEGKSAKQVWLDDHPGSTDADYYDWARGARNWGELEGDLQEQQDLMDAFDQKLNVALVGSANGVAPLGADAKIPTAFFPDEILGNVRFRGTYNGVVVSSAYATFNSLPLPNPTATNAGVYFIVTVPFSKDGNDYSTGDWILSIGALAGWSKVDNSDSVTSVFGRIGNIVALESDYQAFYVRLTQVYNNPIWIGSLAKSKVGLGNVDNTADVDKPVSNPQKTYIDAGDASLKPFYLAQTADYQSAAAIGQRRMFNATPNGQLNLPVGLYQLTLVATLATLNNNTLNLGFSGSAVIADVRLVSECCKGADNSPAWQTVMFTDFSTKTIHTSNVNTMARLIVSGSFRVTTAGSVQPTIGGNLNLAPTTEIGSVFIAHPLGGVGDNHSSDAN
ncbi:hypothetical protein [Flavobacterium caeni]|uniref:Uncharacterized protein n=1 Tax=Flavobacterium caeni TaxID=490189 RepID=A0A1G5K2Q5_9FLAO|nr:hypothetical protein [Flavobacterium caeni]SCY94925.1 hypothetical protein SAMN02927903_03063 [Flavobacterium caeni]